MKTCHQKCDFSLVYSEDFLSWQTLTSDIVAVWKKIKPDSDQPVILVGHSMGAAIAVRAAASGDIASLEGIMVIDVVEGTALGNHNKMGF